MQTSGNPIQTIYLTAFGVKNEVQLSLLREDLNYPIIKGGEHINGNKWRKLQYNIEYVLKHQLKGILTFGGAFSNHLYAVAAAGSAFGFRTIGIVRGEEWETKNNTTLHFCQQQGMQLLYWGRSKYRSKNQFVKQLQSEYPHYWIIPEGGTNDLALTGVSEIIIPHLENYNEIAVPIGTGGTFAGLIMAAKNKSHLKGYSALKMNFQPVIETLLKKHDCLYDNWSIKNDYHFGGYAKFSEALLSFIQKFKTIFGIQLEPLYTGKMMFGIVNQIELGVFKEGNHILAIHTGGLQSLVGFKERWNIEF